MARTAAAGSWSLGRACARAVQRCLGAPSSLAAGLILIGLTFSGVCKADPVRGDATFSGAGGCARLVLKLADDVESEVTAAGSILVIRFKRPVDIAVDKLSDAVPGYVGSARRDPDGSAIRLPWTRGVTRSTMTAGERVFVDLQRHRWSGQLPGLPPEVIRELSERARAAERALRPQRATLEAQKRAPVRVRASVQPTFVRFVFETPEGVGVSSVLNDQKLTLLFNAALSFDLADAKVAAPSNIASINQKIEGESSAVEVALIGDVDVRSFRDEKNYIIDVAFQQGEKPSAFQQGEKHSALPSPAPDASHAAAPAAPASGAPAATEPAATAPGASEKPADAPPAPQQSGEITPPSSESIAQQAKIEDKPVEVQTLEMSTPAPPSSAMPPAAAQAPPSLTAAASEPPTAPRR